MVWTLLSLSFAAFLVTQTPAPANTQAANEENRVPYATLESQRITESSGLVKSRQFDGVFWTLNDSGNKAELFAIDRSGSLLAAVQVLGVTNRDWEALAIDDNGHLYIGDIGNNASSRKDLAVYKVREPDPRTEQRTVSVLERFPFRYAEQPQPPDGSVRNFDSEALFYGEGRLYLLTKHREDTKTRLMRFPGPPGQPRAGALHALSTFDIEGKGKWSPGTVTGADLSQDGRYLAVLSYHTLFVFERPDGSDDFLANPPIVRVSLSQRQTQQCEAVAWDGPDLLFTNEQRDIHRIPRILEIRPTHYP